MSSRAWYILAHLRVARRAPALLQESRVRVQTSSETRLKRPGQYEDTVTHESPEAESAALKEKQ